MNKFTRLYNQNRKQIIVTLCIIIFAFLMIQLFNTAYREINKEKINSQNETTEDKNTENDYTKQSQSLVSDDEITGTYKTDFGNLIDTFLKNCSEKKYNEAYDLLTSDCKNTLYPSKDIFADQYCLKKFTEGKTYDFQAWSTKGAYIYLVKIYDDILSSGRLSNKSYIQDYYSIMEENGEYKLNINGYIGLMKRNNKKESDNIRISVDYSNVYIDYEIYTLTIKNSSDKDILLDSKENTETVYVSDKNDYQYEALMYEVLDEDLLIHTQEEKEIKIKFSNNYNEGINMRKLVFSKIIKDYNNYINDKEGYDNYIKLEIEM